MTARAAPSIKVDGEDLRPRQGQHRREAGARPGPRDDDAEAQQKEFLRDQECNYAIASTRTAFGRFRASAFIQRGQCGMVLRRIKSEIPRIPDLGLPPVVADLAMAKRGLVIFVGGTGTGKSTSLAAMVGHRNRNSRGHILSIEDPIEFIHDHAGCLITQREVGIDTESFETGLQNALRQAPDVILIGEVRSAETMAARPELRRDRPPVPVHPARQQRQPGDRPHPQLLPVGAPSPGAHGPVPEPEGDDRPAAAAARGRPGSRAGDGGAAQLAADRRSHPQRRNMHLIKEVMARSTEQGMQTLDQSLLAKYAEGEITADEAIRCADRRTRCASASRCRQAPPGRGR
jgi:twitching motility protein PilU